MSLFVHSTHLHPHIQLIAQKKVAHVAMGPVVVVVLRACMCE